jgi:hypothetical protein
VLSVVAPLQPQLKGVDAELVGELVQRGLEREVPCASLGTRIDPGTGTFNRRCRSRVETFGQA